MLTIDVHFAFTQIDPAFATALLILARACRYRAHELIARAAAVFDAIRHRLCIMHSPETVLSCEMESSHNKLA